MRRVVSGLALLMLASAAIPSSGGALVSKGALTLAYIDDHLLPAGQFFVEPTSHRPSLVSQKGRPTLAIALTGGDCASAPLTLHCPTEQERARLIEAATRFGPSDRAPPNAPFVG